MHVMLLPATLVQNVNYIHTNHEVKCVHMTPLKFDPQLDNITFLFILNDIFTLSLRTRGP